MLFSLEIIDYIFKKTICDGDGIVRLWNNYVFGQNLNNFYCFPLFQIYLHIYSRQKWVLSYCYLLLLWLHFARILHYQQYMMLMTAEQNSVIDI